MRPYEIHMDQQPLLSIIIPAYNEEHRLPKSLDSIVAFVDDQCAKRGMSIEVLVVENGSRDRTTEIAEAYAGQHPYIQVLHSAKGKGAAVRAGMMAGQGRYLFMCDSDLSMPIEEVLKFLPPALEDYDVAIASREGPGAHRYNEPHSPPRDGPRLQPDRAGDRHSPVSRTPSAASRASGGRWRARYSPTGPWMAGRLTWRRCSLPCTEATRSWMCRSTGTTTPTAA